MNKICGYFYPSFFYNATLPELLSGKRRLHVLLATKDGVGEFASGPFDTGLDGLSVLIQMDSLEYPKQHLDRQAALLKDLFAVVFADLDDLDEALALTRDIRLDHAEAIIVLITDEHTLFSAPDKLRTVIDQVQIRSLVVTGLSGRIPMRKILEHIIRNWQDRKG